MKPSSNAFTLITPEPTRHCNYCNEDKPLRLMVVSPASKAGCRPICKACKNLQQREARKRYIAEAAAQTKQELEERKADLVPARTFVYDRTTYLVPDTNVYYRNNGNKHIPSKGLPT